VAPNEIQALRESLLRYSLTDRRRIIAAIDAKLRAGVHDEVRVGLTALRGSVTTLDQVQAAASELSDEMPALWRSGSSTAERGRALVWWLAAGSAVMGGLSLMKGKLKKFLAFMLLPAAALLARATGHDPLAAIRRTGTETTAVTRRPDGSVDFATAPEGANLLNEELSLRDPAGVERRARLTAPARGLRFQHGGRTFVLYRPSIDGSNTVTPLASVSRVGRTERGGLRMGIPALLIGEVEGEMDAASIDRVLAAARAPGNELRPASVTVTVPVTTMTSGMLSAAVRRAGATPTVAADGRTLTFTTTLQLRPLSDAEIANPDAEVPDLPRPA
jgi:hypothetical protein